MMKTVFLHGLVSGVMSQPAPLVLLNKAKIIIGMILAEGFLGGFYGLARLGFERHNASMIFDFLEKDMRHVRLE